MVDLEIGMLVRRLVQLGVLYKNKEFTKDWMIFVARFYNSEQFADLITEIQTKPMLDSAMFGNGTEKMLKIFAKDKLTPEDDTEELALLMERIRDQQTKQDGKIILKKVYAEGMDKESVARMYQDAERTVRQL